MAYNSNISRKDSEMPNQTASRGSKGFKIPSGSGTSERQNAKTSRKPSSLSNGPKFKSPFKNSKPSRKSSGFFLSSSSEDDYDGDVEKEQASFSSSQKSGGSGFKRTESVFLNGELLDESPVPKKIRSEDIVAIRSTRKTVTNEQQRSESILTATNILLKMLQDHETEEIVHAQLLVIEKLQARKPSSDMSVCQSKPGVAKLTPFSMNKRDPGEEKIITPFQRKLEGFKSRGTAASPLCLDTDNEVIDEEDEKDDCNDDDSLLNPAGYSPSPMPKITAEPSTGFSFGPRGNAI